MAGTVSILKKNTSMKDMTKEEWQKETRYLYQLLKEEHEHDIRLQIALQQAIPLAEGELEKIIDASWIMFCIEKNIKPEDYDI